MTSRPVIVGGGPAGMSAAMELASHHVTSVLLEEASRLGGVVFRGPLRDGVTLDYLGEHYRKSMTALHDEFDRHRSLVDVRLNTRVVGSSGNQLLALTPAERIEPIPFDQLLLAAGCHERSVPFPGWTLPGVIMLGGLQLQIKSGVVKPRGPTVLVGTGPLLPLVACQLHRSGTEVAGIYEACSFGRMAKESIELLNQPQLFLQGLSLMTYLKRQRIPFRFGWGIVEAHGTDELEAVTVAPLDSNWNAERSKQQRVPAQTLAVGYGFIPRTQLTQQIGVDHRYDADGNLVPVQDEWQRSSDPAIHLAGDLGGLRGGEAAMLTGRIAALSMLRQRGAISEPEADRRRRRYLDELDKILRFRAAVNRFTQRQAGQLALATPDTVICRCEQVTRTEIDKALEQGVNDLISLKMRTRAGMGDCQGKVCVGYCSDRLRAQTGKQDIGWLRPRFPIDLLPFSAFARGAETETD